MSQLKDGKELLDGVGATQANSLYDANCERQQAMNRVWRQHFHAGNAATGIIAKWVFPVDVYVEGIEFNAKTAPTGADLIARVVVATVENTEAFTLAAGATWARDLSTNNTGSGAADEPRGILVLAGQSLEIKLHQVGSTVPGADINITLQLALRVL
jgi:hypothetical protein